MSLWEFKAVVGGYAKANAAPDDQGLTNSEASGLAAFLDAPPVWH